MKLVTITIACLVFVANSQAATLTIDFDDIASGTSVPITSGGFDFSGTGPAIVRPYNYFGSGDPANGNMLVASSVPVSDVFTITAFTFAAQDSTPFDLQSFRMQSFLVGSGYFTQFTVRGWYADGGVIAQEFNLDLSAGSLITFDTGWTGLSTVDIFSSGVTFGFNPPLAIDTITVSAVPIPAAVWLFGSGLGLLGWLRRRHTVN